MKRLVIAFTELDFQTFQPRDSSQFGQQLVDVGASTRCKQVDPLRAEQNRSLQSPLLAITDQPFPKWLQVDERSEFVRGNVRNRVHSESGGFKIQEDRKSKSPTE